MKVIIVVENEDEDFKANWLKRSIEDHMSRNARTGKVSMIRKHLEPPDEVKQILFLCSHDPYS